MKLVLSVRMGEQIRFPVKRVFFFFFLTWDPESQGVGGPVAFCRETSRLSRWQKLWDVRCRAGAAQPWRHRRENWGMDSRNGVQRRSAAAHPCGIWERMTLTHGVLYVSPWLFQFSIEAEHNRMDHVTARRLASRWSGKREKGQERGRILSLRTPFRAAPPLSLLLKVLVLSYRTGWWLCL